MNHSHKDVKAVPFEIEMISNGKQTKTAFNSRLLGSRRTAILLHMHDKTVLEDVQHLCDAMKELDR